MDLGRDVACREGQRLPWEQTVDRTISPDSGMGVLRPAEHAISRWSLGSLRRNDSETRRGSHTGEGRKNVSALSLQEGKLRPRSDGQPGSLGHLCQERGLHAAPTPSRTHVTDLAGASLALHGVHKAQQVGFVHVYVPGHVNVGVASVLQDRHLGELRAWRETGRRSHALDQREAPKTPCFGRLTHLGWLLR